jgi:uncharacterized protein (UPF0305 family)
MRQVRNGVFETNSSSVHSITMCMKSDYDKWVNGELYWDRWSNKFVTKEVVEKFIEKLREEFREDNPDYVQGDEEWEEEFMEYVDDDKQYYTYEEFNDYECIEYETFANTFTTPSGEEVVSFGYYGNCY